MATTLITGASHGIGYEFAKLFAEDGHNLVLTARDEKALMELAAKLRKKHNVETHVIKADLGSEDAVKKIIDYIEENNLEIDFLVNNAGIGLSGDFIDNPLERIDNMILVNIKSLVDLTHYILPKMISKKFGRILNIASTAGFQPGPGMAIEYATQTFPLFFS